MPCGISGFVGEGGKDRLKKMVELLTHRGPDSSGLFLDSGVGLGINRLSIIDLRTGDQPIHNEDESLWIVFNGEIYNYKELREDLEGRGHRFYTETDTETVVHAFEEWREECVQHLRGMFAFAIWDKRRKSMYIARDRYGKKPLYYALLDGTLVFASEMKAILPWGSFTIDRYAMDLYFTYLYVPSPYTIFREIKKLPPASYLTYSKGVLKIETYWDVDFKPDSDVREDEIMERLYGTMLDAVRIRMRSDVPLGAFLSGGIDSSTIVALMAKLSEEPVHTFSIGFDQGIDETPFARQVAELYGTDHREHIVSMKVFEILPKLVWHFDEPFADHSFIPTYYLSQVTRNQVKVALSGDGGDEIFMGYPFLYEPNLYRAYRRVPRGLRRAMLRSILALPIQGQFTRMANHAYEKDYGDQPETERYIMRVTAIEPAGLTKLYSSSFMKEHRPNDSYSYLREWLQRCHADTAHKLDYATLHTYLQEDILTKVDRMSMAVSLEVRCPLLDQALTEVVAKIPAHMKLRGGLTKYMFKKMVVEKGLLPRDIAYRSKQGFGAPIDKWLKSDWKDLVSQVLDPVISSNYTGFFDREYLAKMLRQPYLYSGRLFSMVTFVLWYKTYVEEGFKAPLMI